MVLKGLLPKSEEDLLVPMTPAQQDLYAHTVKRIAEQALERQRLWEAEGAGGAAGGRGRGAAEVGFGGEHKKWVKMAFTELRKVAQHPLLVRHEYQDLERIAWVLKCEEEFGEQASLEMVRAELANCSDLDLHLYCSRYPALHKLRLPAEALLKSGKARPPPPRRLPPRSPRCLPACSPLLRPPLLPARRSPSPSRAPFGPQAARLAELLPQLLGEGHRVLIFSQWTSTLDTLGLLLEHLGIRNLRFDGSTAAPERQRLIDEFNEDETIGVFLLTTRAGGLGINLTAADTVIIHDVDFNPAADRQAMDRAHRMGQLRPVRVIKLASAATVDEQVLKIAASKLAQQSAILGGGASRKARKPKADEGDDEAADGAADEDAHEDLMGGILRDLLHVQRAASGQAGDGLKAEAERGGAAQPMEPDAAAEEQQEAAEEEQQQVAAAEEPDDGAGAAAAAMEVEGTDEAASEAAGGEAEAAQEEVKASEGEAGGVPSEAQLRAHIVSNRPAIQDGSLRDALDSIGAHFGVDVRQAGLKPLIKALLSELLN